METRKEQSLLGQTESSGGGSIGLPSLDGYGPQISLGENATGIISKILGVLTVVGSITVVIAISLIGFNSILGSASEKAFDKQKLVGVVIGAIVMTCGSVIAKLIISVAQNL